MRYDQATITRVTNGYVVDKVTDGIVVSAVFTNHDKIMEFLNEKTTKVEKKNDGRTTTELL
jgi:hypothetical protein